MITSGNITDVLRSDALQVGVRHLLQKEFTLERLVRLVHGILEPALPPATTTGGVLLESV